LAILMGVVNIERMCTCVAEHKDGRSVGSEKTYA